MGDASPTNFRTLVCRTLIRTCLNRNICIRLCFSFSFSLPSCLHAFLSRSCVISPLYFQLSMPISSRPAFAKQRRLVANVDPLDESGGGDLRAFPCLSFLHLTSVQRPLHCPLTLITLVNTLSFIDKWVVNPRFNSKIILQRNIAWRCSSRSEPRARKKSHWSRALSTSALRVQPAAYWLLTTGSGTQFKYSDSINLQV